jgi:hypothetical protein
METGCREMRLTRAEPEINIDIYDPEISSRTVSMGNKENQCVLTCCRNTLYQVHRSGLENIKSLREQEWIRTRQ